MLEQIIFHLLAFSFFILMFAQFIKRKDSNYLYILGVQLIGILLNIALSIAGANNIVLKIIAYLLSIIVPICIFALERKNINFGEFSRIALSKFYLSTHNDEKAKKQLLKLVEKYPKSYIGHKYLAQYYRSKGKLELAIEEYTIAIELNNKDYDTYYFICELLQEQKRSDESIVMLNELLKKKPQYYKASILLGDILYEKEMFKEAINIYQEALKHNPEQYDLYYNLAMTYTRINDFQSAKEYYEKAAQLNSLLYVAKLNLGQIALIYNDLEMARQYFTQSIQDEEVEAIAYYYLAQIAMIYGEKDNAINYLNTALKMEPKLIKNVEQENIFSPIIGRINIPNSMKENIKNKELTQKEDFTINYLSKTYELIESMNNNDMEMIKNLNKTKENEREL